MSVESSKGLMIEWTRSVLHKFIIDHRNDIDDINSDITNVLVKYIDNEISTYTHKERMAFFKMLMTFLCSELNKFDAARKQTNTPTKG